MFRLRVAPRGQLPTQETLYGWVFSKFSRQSIFGCEYLEPICQVRILLGVWVCVLFLVISRDVACSWNLTTNPCYNGKRNKINKHILVTRSALWCNLDRRGDDLLWRSLGLRIPAQAIFGSWCPKVLFQFVVEKSIFSDPAEFVILTQNKRYPNIVVQRSCIPAAALAPWVSERLQSLLWQKKYLWPVFGRVC